MTKQRCLTMLVSLCCFVLVGVPSSAHAAELPDPGRVASEEPTTITTFGYVPDDEEVAPRDEVLHAVEDEGLGVVQSGAGDLDDSPRDAQSRAAIRPPTNVNPHTVKSTWKDN